MSRRYTKRRYRKSSRRKLRSKLRGGSKKPKAFIYTHLGLGDMCLMIGAVRYLATKYDKVTVVCKKMYEDTIKGIYADDTSIHFHMVSGDEDMKPWKEKAKKYESEGYDVYGCGMFSLKTDGKIHDFPNSFYDDLGIPRTARTNYFRLPETDAAKSLYEAFKGRPYIIVHQSASHTKLPILEKLRKAGEKRLIIDVNKNQVDKDADPEGYALAEKCINRPFTEYVKLFEGADELHMIDSSVFCFAMHLDLSSVKKRVYYIRPGGIPIDNFGKFEEGKISQTGGNESTTSAPPLKVAMLIVGRIRGYENVKDNLGRIMNKYNPTVFCSLNKKNKSDYIKGFCEFMKIDDERLVLEPTPPAPEYYYNIEPRHPGYDTQAQTGRLEKFQETYHSLWYQLKRTFQILEKYQKDHNMKFDCILNFRADVESPDEITLTKPEPNTIYIPTFENIPHDHADEGGIQCAIFYCDYETSKYCNYIYDSMKDLTEKDKVLFGFGEGSFKKHIDKINTKIVRFPYRFEWHPSRQIRNPAYNDIP